MSQRERERERESFRDCHTETERGGERVLEIVTEKRERERESGGERVLEIITEKRERERERERAGVREF